MGSQERAYDQFLQTGHGILDRTSGGTATDAARITGQLDAINRAWDKLQTRLGMNSS